VGGVERERRENEEEKSLGGRVVESEFLFSIWSGVWGGYKVDDQSGCIILEMSLLNCRITYMMINLYNYQNVGFVYDPDGELGKTVFPKGVNTKNKIIVRVEDIREEFINKSREDLLILFWAELMSISSVLEGTAITDMDTDIVAVFFSGDGNPLAYFYQGKYRFWED